MPRPFRTRQGSVECEVDTTVLNRILANLETNTTDAVRAVAFAVEAKAKPKTRLDTGALRSSIYTRVGLARTPLPEVVGDPVRVELPRPENNATAHVGPSVEYGIYQELGTERMSAQPYLGPAVAECVNELERHMRNVVTDGS